MRIDVRYGKRGLALDLPDDVEATIIHKKHMPVAPDKKGTVRDALSKPIGCRPLSEEARGCKNVCICICDVTRPVPNGIVLPALVDRLMEAGVAPEAITVLVATGLHRPNEGDELREVVGSDRVLATVRTANHFAKNEADHVFLGTTSCGMPVKLDRRFVDADMRIVVGLVEPHFMAGYSGGRKVVIPGVAHEETIGNLHSTRMLVQEMVDNAIVEANPLHQAQIEGTRMVGRIFAVNTVIDEERRLSYVTFGDLEESHLKAVAFARPYFEISMGRRFATVVTTSAGYPLDRNYYQTVKGMVGVTGITAPGADLFIASECSEGLGAPEFAVSQRRFIAEGAQAFLDATSKQSCAAVDEWETVMQIKAMKAATIHLYSDRLSPEDKALTGIDCVESLSEAVTGCLRKKGDRRVAIIPEGPYVIPKSG